MALKYSALKKNKFDQISFYRFSNLLFKKIFEKDDMSEFQLSIYQS